MLAYLIQLIFIVLLYSILKNKRVCIGFDKNCEKQQGVNIALFAAFLVIIIMQAFRAPTVGTDVYGYLDLFHKVQNVTNIADLTYNRYGFGFAWLAKAISLISKSDRCFLIVTTLIIQTPIAIIINKYSRNKLMSIFLYVCLGFYMATFCTLRQCMTYSLCFLSYYGIRERKFWAFAIPVVCASLLHVSAIVFIPAYWIYWIKSKRKTIILYLVTIAFAYIFRIQLVSTFLSRFDSYFYYYSIQETGANTWTLICVCVYILASFLKKKYLITDEYDDSGIKEIDGGLLSIYGVGTILSVCSTVATNARRITDFYILFMILIIPEMYESIQHENNKKIFFWSITIFCVLFYVITLMRNGGYGIIPYQFGG